MDCPSQRICGACPLLETDYPHQLELKKEEVSRSFASSGLRVTVHDVVGMDNPYHYRNKVIAYLTMRKGRIVCGMYEEHSHSVVNALSCQLQDSVLNDILADIIRILESLKIMVDGFGGVLKSVALRRGVHTGQVMTVFVTSDRMFHGSRELVRLLVSHHPEIRTIIQNVNPRRTSVIFGDREKVMYGPGYILDDILGHRFKISARSFYQVNPVQTEKLYAKALDLAGLTGAEVLLDAYCGIGTIGICASGAVRSVIGVEINRDAVEDAKSNARAASIANARYVCADASAFMREFEGDVDVLMVDPPRSGCDREFLRSVMRLSPRRIVYISCDPHSQARDIAFFGGGYTCSDAYPFDMFPHTSHVENIVCLYNGDRQ